MAGPDGARIAMAGLTTDPARFEVVKNALTSAAEEMKIVLAKTAYSPLLKVAGDYSCGIFESETSTLHDASIAKFDAACSKLALQLSHAHAFHTGHKPQPITPEAFIRDVLAKA